MTEVLFYHLERGGVEGVLPDLLEKTLGRGWRAVVRTINRERVNMLDNHLWVYRDESFLPHASAGDGAGQPVWLTDGEDVPNGAELLFLVDGAKTEASALDNFVRCVTIFDGRDDEALGDARQFWKETKAAGHDVAYWRQSPEGRWEKQA
ncbi:DNA polymerase III subunit chi [Hyphococcus sp. DH-69]|uniref:DNA polymerase III subunit chi n=1 Tax=Hyphococcus formosus TaxID=3143534 RepID=UPI00398A8C19